MTHPRTAQPKYAHAYQVIVERLKSGRYPVGARMPTESELSAHFHVSRVTIRRALDMLVQDGYIERKQGSGYKVLTLSPASDTCLTSFTDALLRSGREPTARLLSVKSLKSNSTVARELPGSLRSQAITRINRLRLVDAEPWMLVKTYLPTRLVRGISPRDFPESGPGQSMLRVLANRFGLEWFTACEDISPVLATRSLAKSLDVPLNHLLLQQSCSAFDTRGDIVFHEDVFRSGPLSFNLTRQIRSPRHV